MVDEALHELKAALCQLGDALAELTRMQYVVVSATAQLRKQLQQLVWRLHLSRSLDLDGLVPGIMTLQ